MNTNTLAELFYTERDIPYQIPLSCNEIDHCCSGKHERLIRVFKSAGYESRYRVCWFRWSDLKLPAEVASVPHDDDCSHVYLEVKIGERWYIIDATWDPGLASVLPVNEWIDGADMVVAVPAIKILSPEASAEFMTKITVHDTEADLDKHREFYRALNNWLSEIRDI